MGTKATPLLACNPAVPKSLQKPMVPFLELNSSWELKVLLSVFITRTLIHFQNITNKSSLLH